MQRERKQLLRVSVFFYIFLSRHFASFVFIFWGDYDNYDVDICRFNQLFSNGPIFFFSMQVKIKE